ncbi:L,D-transpeptidase [Leifsonia virtsii]|uniref:L,D-transpeptidase n=1 Tax=Leifsonia virtsii TaxID=3035915 RepID=UPI00263B0DDB|nr:L,D-transpeptidase [Leifsonia virtsii]
MSRLPAADYRAVIPGLIAEPSSAPWSSVFQLQADAPLFGSDRAVPVARFEARDFLGEPSVVVRVAVDGPWSLVLVPSRQVLPSQSSATHPAPAQSAGWLPTSALTPRGAVKNRIVISVSAQSLTITDAAGRPEQTFSVGVGAAGTPTPIGVTGYLEAQYLDPAQGQSVHRIQLTSLHATAADEPYGGADGGLIGIHYEAVSSGAVSHGCVRLGAQAIAAVDALALGTPIVIAA